MRSYKPVAVRLIILLIAALLGLQLSGIALAGYQAQLEPQAAASAVEAPMVVLATVGQEHSCAIISGGEVLCWGRNNYGQLGNDSTDDSLDPVLVEGLAGSIVALASGQHHTCALNSDGAVFCWGRNFEGQLGDGSTTNRRTAVAVSGLSSGVTAIGAGYEHTCAVLTGGALKCWGKNHRGQLGDNSTTNRSTPVGVMGVASGAVKVSGGWGHTCALISNGMKCWGYNSDGQLGDGSTDDRLTPTQVSGLTSGVTAITVGRDHTCAVVSGAAKCWGNNLLGAVGNNSLAFEIKSPETVSGLTAGVTAVTAGHNYACALVNGGAQCWGVSNWGQVGDGLGDNTRAPAAVSGLGSGVTGLSARVNHTCAWLTGGALKCWGHNDYGQLGDGSTTDRKAPIPSLNGPLVTMNLFLPFVQR